MKLKCKVLFVCSTNGLHSAMAEALLKRLDSEHFEAVSAGISSGRLHPLTIEVMKEMGIDLGQMTLRLVHELADDKFDYVITLGERTADHGRNFRGAEVIHWKFDDLVAESDDRQKQLRAFRAVRDQIAQRLNLFALVLSRPRTVTRRNSVSIAQTVI